MHAQLTCDAPSFDFGTLPETVLSVAHAFTVRNTGTEPVRITAVRSSCDCMTASPATSVVRPGASVPVNTYFVFKTESGPQRRAVHLAYRIGTDETQAETKVCTLWLHGTILWPVQRLPNRLEFGLVPPGGIATAAVRLVSGRCGAFSLRSVAVDRPDAHVDYTPKVRATNHLVRVSFPTPDRLGVFSGIVLAATDQEEMPDVPIAYSGRVAPWITVRPASLTFRANAGAQARLTFSSPHGTAFRLRTSVATVPWLSAAIDNDRCVTITATAVPATHENALIRIATDHPACPFIEVPVQIAPQTARQTPKAAAP